MKIKQLEAGTRIFDPEQKVMIEITFPDGKVELINIVEVIVQGQNVVLKCASTKKGFDAGKLRTDITAVLDNLA